jgi:hypothetical protein
VKINNIKNIAEMTGRWYEDLQNYERNLDEMASVNLDQVIINRHFLFTFFVYTRLTRALKRKCNTSINGIDT